MEVRCLQPNVFCTRIRPLLQSRPLTKNPSLLRTYISSHPKDSEMYSRIIGVIMDQSVAQLQMGHHSQAAESLQVLVADDVTREKLMRSESELSAHRLRRNLAVISAVAAELYEYCAQCAGRDSSLSSKQSTDFVLDYRKNRDVLRSQLQMRAEQWLAAVNKSDDRYREVAALIDGSYLVTSRAKTPLFYNENGSFERTKAFVKAYVSFIELSARPPSDWPGIAILLASCPEYPVAPSTLVRFCKLALQETPDDVIAKQAYALALLRDGNADECVKIIESDSVRDQRGSAWILALGYSHVGNKSKASELLQELERTMEANGEKLGSRSGTFNSKKQISNDTLDRFQWEVQGLLDMRQAEKQDSKASTE